MSTKIRTNALPDCEKTGHNQAMRKTRSIDSQTTTKNHCPIGTLPGNREMGKCPANREVASYLAMTRKLYSSCVRCFVPQHDKLMSCNKKVVLNTSSGRRPCLPAGRPTRHPRVSNNSAELLRKQPVPTLDRERSHFFEVPFSLVLSFLPAGRKESTENMMTAHV